MTTVYPTLNSAAAVTVSTSKRRLSGFSGNLVDESISLDIHGNTTVQSTEIDRTTQTVTRTTDSPSSTIDAVSTSINGYLISQSSSTVAAATTYDYDDLGRRISVKDPRHAQASTIDYYTGTRQVFTQTDGAGNTTSYTYIANGQTGAGQVASVTNALLKKSYYAYDLLGRQVRTWGETDYPQAYSYSSYGELETLTTWRDTAIDFSTATWPNPTGGDVTTWIYQPSTGLLTRKEYADNNGTDYTYDSANRLGVRTWARDGGLDTTYSYDANTGELLTVDYEAADTADITYTYDRLGRQATVTDATGTRTFVYDSASLQLDSETLDSVFYKGQILTRSSDAHGRSTGYSLKNSASSAISAVNYTYDTSGRLATVADSTDTFTYGYEPNSNLLASLTAPQHTVAYTYEPNRNVMTIIDNKVSGSSLSKYAYTYDSLGRRDDRTQSGSALTTSTDDFGYNNRSEVTGSTNSVEIAAEYTPSYSYDQSGNRVTATGGVLSSASATYTSNALNQYTAISAPSAVNPTHDLDGNLLSSSTWTYEWNNENRLVNATNGTTSIDFLYDYQGRLVKKDDGTNVEVYLYDGWNRIATFDLQTSNLTLQTSYTWGLELSGSIQGAGGVGGLLKESEFDSNSQLLTSLFCVYDANGNITQKLDGSANLVMNVDYDPFGNIISGSLTGEYGFSTKPLIDGILMSYYGFRYYDPVTGRWPSRDPIGESGNDLLRHDSYMLSYSESILRIETASVFNAYRDLINYVIHFDYDYERYYEVLYDYENKAAFLSEVSSWYANLKKGSFHAELLMEGPNLYAFVGNEPISYYDPFGLNGQPSIPNPNGVVPGGPWVPAGPGQQPGTFFGPKPSSGPRSICRYVPSQANGGPAGAQNPYWKTQTPGQNGWLRYNMSGNPITPGQAHGGRSGSGGGSSVGGGGGSGGGMRSPGRGGGRAPRGGGGGGSANPHLPHWMP